MEIQKTGMSSDNNSTAVEGEAQVQAPKRVMGGFSATMIVVASMVGTGVFTTSGVLLETTPSATAILISWLIGGVVAFFGALSYAELVSIYPQNGGEYQLLSKIFHPALGFIAGWISLMVGFSAPIASAAMAFGEYASNTFPELNKFWAAVIVILVLSVVHAVRVTFGSAVQNIFTVLKIFIVSAFIIGGFFLGDFSLISHETVADTSSIMFSPAFAVGLIYITYAYTGWNGSAYIAGEVKNPTKAVPRALAFGTILVTLIYIGLNTVFLAAAPLSELTGKVDIGAVAAIHLFGENIGNIFSAIIAVLLISSISAMIMEGPRIYQSVGDDYPSFHFLSKRKGDS
ncbi:MAG: amino acid permease, partial [Proteobacteria bacterium]|nr:amino acid permease [Pseudomonadota bacterium]